jgi:hypothetical protein
MMKKIVVFLFMHSLSYYHIFLAIASPTKHKLLPYEAEDLIRELAFMRPVQIDQVLKNTLKMPPKVLMSIFQNLNYAQVCEIAKHLDDATVNPIDRVGLNPLKYHNAYSDDQAAIKEWYITSNERDLESLVKFGFYLGQLLDNPTVIINTNDSNLMKRIVKVASIQRDPEVYKALFTKLKSRYDNINLSRAWKYGNVGVIRFLLDKKWIVKSPFALYEAQQGDNKELIRFLENEGIYGFYVRRSPYDETSEVNLPRYLQDENDERG